MSRLETDISKTGWSLNRPHLEDGLGKIEIGTAFLKGLDFVCLIEFLKVLCHEMNIFWKVPKVNSLLYVHALL